LFAFKSVTTAFLPPAKGKSLPNSASNVLFPHTLATPNTHHKWLDRLSGGSHNRNRANRIRHPIGQRVGSSLMATQQRNGVTARLVQHHDSGIVMLVSK